MKEKILNICGDVFITCLENLQAFFHFGECMYVGFSRNMGDCMFSVSNLRTITPNPTLSYLAFL